MKSYWQVALELKAASIPFVTVTFVSVRGSAPQNVGAKAIVTPSGLHFGTVGGGKIEAHTIRYAREMLARLLETSSSPAEPELKTWNLQRDIGMTCGGEVTLLFEPTLHDSWPIAIFGAGHVAQALVRALEPLECQITCVDPRSEWIERLPKAPNISPVCISEPAKQASIFKPHTYFIVMTQGHATDVPVLQAIFESHPKPIYLGAIGSDVKAIKLKSELKSRGVSDAFLESIRCPIGLPIGGNSPAEIAVSIAAELLKIKNEKKAVDQPNAV